MKIIIEKNIPFIHGLLEPYAQVEYLAPHEFTSEAVKNADALVVRTRTRCDAALLAGSKVRFIATATIGTDHIDMPWCEKTGITVANAPGCNAPAVAQYVLSSIHHLSNRPMCQYTIGIVGVGHVGRIVEQWARCMDMTVLLNDPPRQAAEGGDNWISLDEIAEKSDIITFHTPLDASTHHLVDEKFLNSLRRAPIIINAARGGVVDNKALSDAIDKGAVGAAVIDCWENEPSISKELLGQADIATPHIAGYSYEGKVRATRMALDALTSFFGLPDIKMEQNVPDGACKSVTAKAVSASYNPFEDTAALKNSPDDFEVLRNHYKLRHEVAGAKID